MKANWIWGVTSPNEKQVIMFRKTAVLNGSDIYPVRITADTQYILYVNGKTVCRGPCKSMPQIKYYEQIDIAPFLKTGKNTLAVKVLRQPNDMWLAAGSCSAFRSDMAGLWLEDENNLFSTDRSWKWKRDESYGFAEPAAGSQFLDDMETVDGRLIERDWCLSEFSDSDWQYASEITDDTPWTIDGIENFWPLEHRPIPMLGEKHGGFKTTLRGHDIINEGTVTVPAGQTMVIELDAGMFTTAYFKLCLDGGAGAKIRILYAESYFSSETVDKEEKSKLRIPGEYSDGCLWGFYDEYITGEGYQIYEPFFMRTFRFVQLTLTAGDRPLTLISADFSETAYPLEILGEFKSDRETDKRCLDISLRTLRMCMHETYEDCPYFEQLQYVQDTMLEALFTYPVSHDIRLVEKAIAELASSQRPDGMIYSAYPDNRRQLIPGFSLSWITLLYNHYFHTGDKSFLKNYLPTAEKIAQYFLNRIGCDSGLAEDLGYWEFIDWTDGWKDRFGTCMHQGEKYQHINYIYNMMLTDALKKLSFLCGETARVCCEEEYAEKAEELTKAVHKHAYDSKKGLYKNFPGDTQFSCHAQIWAVLSGAATGEKAKRLMHICLTDKTLLEPSYCYTFYFFRALEQAQMYEESGSLWLLWDRLMAMDITTWPEDFVTQRSDCHGWSSVPLYEYYRCILGVQSDCPGCEELVIRPFPMGRKRAEGKVCIPQGTVAVKWRIIKDVFKIDVALPKGVRAKVICPDGTERFFDFEGERTVALQGKTG